MPTNISYFTLVFMVLCFTTLISSSPTLTEREEKKVPPIMQTLLTDMAKELISRSTSNSQVMTLNFTNLLILMVLKGLLWGASYAGATTANKGRAEEVEEPLITETEVLMLLSYLMGDQGKDFDCLHRIACEDPEKAKEYLNAGIVIMNAAKFIGIESSNNDKYDKLIDELQEAVQFKVNGGKCETKYTCLHSANENTI